MNISNGIFHSARRRGFWKRLRSKFSHECNDLLPTNRVLSRLTSQVSRDLGIQTVSLEHVVGSSGRSTTFDLQFNPLQEKLRPRWLGVAGAALLGRILPPVKLIQVGNAYFVEDGHHRISVARWLGEHSIEAHVLQLDPSGLKKNHTCTRLGYEV